MNKYKKRILKIDDNVLLKLNTTIQDIRQFNVLSTLIYEKCCNII